MMTMKSRRNLTMLGLTLLAFGLRAYRLDFQSYWIDESWTVHFVNLPLAELWQALQTVEIHPPLYFPSLKLWRGLLGDGEYALRFYSLLFGTLVVPLTYRLGQALENDRLGLAAALLMTVAPFQLWHSQEARMYSLLTAASVMSMWGFVMLWRRNGFASPLAGSESGLSASWRWWLLYILGTAWTLLAHYHGFVLIGIQGLFLLLTWRRHWRSYPLWGAALLLILLLYSPWLAQSWRFVGGYRGWLEQPGLAESYLRSGIAFSVGRLVPRPQAIPMMLVFVVPYGLGLIAAARRGGWPKLAFLLAYTLAPNLAAWLYGELRTPVYFERYLIPVQVGFLLTAALGILAAADGLAGRLKRLPRPLIIAALLLPLVGINGWVLYHHYVDPVYAKPDWRKVARTVEAFELPGDGIIITGDGGEKTFAYYYRGQLPLYFDFNTPVPPPERAREILAGIAARHRRLWYTPYGVDIDATLEGWLGENAYPAWQSWLGRKRLALYGGSGTDLGRVERTGVSSLSQAALPERTIAAGDLLPLRLSWQAEAALSEERKLSLRLLNDSGDIFSQSDWPPLPPFSPGRPVTDRRSLWLRPDTPPGLYNLQLLLYDPATGQTAGQPALIREIAIGPAEIAPPPELLAIPNPVRHRLGDITLIGYTAPDSLRPGEQMWLWLYWQALASPPAEATLRLSLRSGETEAAISQPLAGPQGVGPLAGWQAGQVRRAVYHLPTTPRLTGPQATLTIGLGQAEIRLTEIGLESRPRQFEPPAIAHPVDIGFGQPVRLTLIGYDLPAARLSPGQALETTLYWRADREMERDYTVFIQLLNGAGQVVAQQDARPQAGAAPTMTWLPGEIITDPYRLALPADLPPGPHRLITGLYHAPTGQRLPLASGGDFVELAEIVIE